MRARFLISTLAAVGLSSLLVWPESGQAQTARIPAFTVTDDDGTVLGPFLDQGPRAGGVSSQIYVKVLMRDTMNDESYTLFVGKFDLQGVDEDDIYYENADCTGIAYLQTPENYPGSLAEMRGSVYAIGFKFGATDTDSLVMRASGTGADNSALMGARYRSDADGSGTGCNAGQSTTNPTVVATEAADLSGFIRPFKIE